MKNKIRVALFPKNHESDIIYRYREEMLDFAISAIVSYQGNELNMQAVKEGVLCTDLQPDVFCIW